MHFTQEEKEELAQVKNKCVKEILLYMESNIPIFELDFISYNKTRNVVRYNINRLLNQFFRIAGDDTVIKLRREHNGNRPQNTANNS